MGMAWCYTGCFAGMYLILKWIISKKIKIYIKSFREIELNPLKEFNVLNRFRIQKDSE